MTASLSFPLAAVALAGAFVAPHALAAGSLPDRAGAGLPPGTAVPDAHEWPGGPTHDFGKYSGLQAVSSQVEGDFNTYTLDSGFTNIGRPMTIKCTTTCVITATSMVEVTTIDGFWMVCPVVDGLSGVSGCPWQGSTPQLESPDITGNGTFVWHLAAGTHTLQPMVYLIYGGQLLNWTLVATLYQ
jgi:hypothetical protein